MLNAGIIGFGGIAKAHRSAYANLEKQGKARLVCACDIDPEAFTRKATINLDTGKTELREHIRFYTDLEQMLEKEEVDLLDLCVPTFLHKELAVKLLSRGYHVMCEKPMALTYDDCTEMLRAAKENGKQLMIGQCLRFFPAYDYAKGAIEDGRFGRVLGAFFSRLSPPPTWGWDNWFMDPERSGGCITDLHIHDVDMVRYLFGEPEAVSCRASTSLSVHDTVYSSFFCGDIPVTAIGDWTLIGVPFSASYRLDFEKATLVSNASSVTVYPKDGNEAYKAELHGVGGYEGELSYFCDVIVGRTENVKNPPESAARTISLVEHLRESAKNGGRVLPFMLKS